MKKQVRLKKLNLTNYRNIERLELDFGGKDSAIVGENHVGKTNALEAIVVLLDGTLLDGSSDLAAIKPLDDTKKVSAIEAVFSIDGEDFAVKKEYGEDWVRARGTDELTMKGHFQKLYIQGTRVERAREFQSAIREAFGMPADETDRVDYIRMLMLPTYLGDMGEGKDWTALRSFVIDLVGDVEDADVFAANPSLAIIEEELKRQRGSVDAVKRKLKQDSDGIKMSIAGSEAVVASLEATAKPSDEAVSIAKRAIDEHDQAIAMLRSSSGTDVESERMQRELSELQKEMIEEQKKAFDEANKPIEDAKEAIRAKHKEAVADYSAKCAAVSAKMDERFKVEAEAKRLEAEKEAVGEGANGKLVDRIREIDATEIKVDGICPTCGQALPADKIAEAEKAQRTKLQAERAELVAQCRKNKSDRAELESRIVEKKTMIAAIDDEIDEARAASDKSLKALNAIEAEARAIPQAEPRKESPKEAGIRARIEQLEAKLKKSREDFQSGLRDVASAIAKHQEDKKPFQKTLDDFAYWERQEAKLGSEKASLAKLRKDLAVCEQKRECAAQFLFAKLKMIDENVAKVFGNIRIKLIKENINGGFDPVCKPYIFDTEKNESTKVSWASGSKSERIETGIAIAEAIKEAKDLPDLPILFDEGGEISSETLARRLKTSAQIVCVKVLDDIPFPAAVPLR